MKSALPVLVQKRYASPNAERALLQISQCVEREGPDLLAIDRFRQRHEEPPAPKHAPDAPADLVPVDAREPDVNERDIRSGRQGLVDVLEPTAGSRIAGD